MSVGHLVLVLLTVYNASEHVTQKDYPSLKETDQLDQRNTHQGLHFPFRQRRVHKHSVSARSESQCGAHAVTEDRTADSDAEDDDEVRNDSDSDQSQSVVSEPQSQDLCEVCLVQQRDTRLALNCAVRAPAFLYFLRRTAWATSSRCPICRTDISLVLRLYYSGSDMLLMLTMYCLRTIRTVFCHCVLIFFNSF